MLRNIPNKMDQVRISYSANMLRLADSTCHQATLKDIVDETNRGEYDFMYLRIGKCFCIISRQEAYQALDFANNCK